MDTTVDATTATVSAKTECSPMPAYRLPYNEAIAPPHAPMFLALCPPAATSPTFERTTVIDTAEQGLAQELQTVTNAAQEDRRQLQQNLLDIHLNGQRLEQRIADEYIAMEDTMNELQHQFQALFQAAVDSIESKTRSHFERVEAKAIASQEQALCECEVETRQFYDVSVPEILERLQGSITRKLEKNHESFDIENAKTRKRECKIAAMLDTAEHDTQHTFAIERDRRLTKFFEREDACHDAMRVDNRASERIECQHVHILASLHHQLEEEIHVREREDATLFSRVGTSFHRLQASVLENLGDAT